MKWPQIFVCSLILTSTVAMANTGAAALKNPPARDARSIQKQNQVLRQMMAEHQAKGAKVDLKDVVLKSNHKSRKKMASLSARLAKAPELAPKATITPERRAAPPKKLMNIPK